jgi:hypothetical protein
MAVRDAPAETIISGDVVDESHLHGVLALIQTLGLRVVSVNEVPRGAADDPASGDGRTTGP